MLTGTIMLLCVLQGLGHLWILSLAWQERDWGWLVTLLFLPPSAIFYAIVSEEARKPLVLVLVLPFAIVVAAAVSPGFRTDPEGELRRALALEERKPQGEPKQPVAPKPAAVAKGERPPDIAATWCRVKSTPPGAPVFLDGKPTGQVTPAKLTIYAGRDNVVSVRLRGYVPATEAISPNLNQNTERDYTLAEGTPLAVRSIPQGAEVLVDGERVLEQTPGEVEGIAYGPHQVVVRKKGLADVIVDVTAKEAKPLSLDVSLYAEARVRVKSLPPHAEISVDGRPTRQFTPADIVVSSEEAHVFVVTHPKYLEASLKVAPVAANELEEVMIPLELPTVRTVSARLEELEEALATRAAARNKTAARLAAARKKQRPEADALEDELAAQEHALASAKLDVEQLRSLLTELKKRD